MSISPKGRKQALAWIEDHLRKKDIAEAALASLLMRQWGVTAETAWKWIVDVKTYYLVDLEAQK